MKVFLINLVSCKGLFHELSLTNATTYIFLSRSEVPLRSSRHGAVESQQNSLPLAHRAVHSCASHTHPGSL